MSYDPGLRRRKHLTTVEPLASEVLDERLVQLQDLYTLAANRHSDRNQHAECTLVHKYLFGAHFRIQGATDMENCRLDHIHLRLFPKGSATVEASTTRSQTDIIIKYSESSCASYDTRTLFIEAAWLVINITTVVCASLVLCSGYNVHWWYVRDGHWFA